MIRTKQRDSQKWSILNHNCSHTWVRSWSNLQLSCSPKISPSINKALLPLNSEHMYHLICTICKFLRIDCCFFYLLASKNGPYHVGFFILLTLVEKGRMSSCACTCKWFLSLLWMLSFSWVDRWGRRKAREAETTAGVTALKLPTLSAVGVCSSRSERRSVCLACVRRSLSESGPLATETPGMTLNADGWVRSECEMVWE